MFLNQLLIASFVLHWQAVEISSAVDAENTEQDVSAAGESLENLAETETEAGGHVALEDIMDQHSQVRFRIFIFLLKKKTNQIRW